jgi:hypothetical protein
MLDLGFTSFPVSLFPRVDDPWPDTVGLDLPVIMAGVGGAVASVIYARAPTAERDEAIRYGGLGGFGLGALLYVLALLGQIVSG